MRTKSTQTTIFVFLEETRKRAQRVNGFLKAGGRESKAEVVPTTDLLLQAPLSHEG